MSNGHSLSEVRKYTLRQLYFFTSLVQKRKKLEHLNLVDGFRMAMNANAKDYEQYQKIVEAD